MYLPQSTATNYNMNIWNDINNNMKHFQEDHGDCTEKCFGRMLWKQGVYFFLAAVFFLVACDDEQVKGSKQKAMGLD